MAKKSNYCKPRLNTDEDTDDKRDVIKIGQQYLVKRRDDLVKAEIIKIRYNKKGKCKECYVHYDSHNRRLDEWVSFDRVILHNIESSEDSKPCDPRSSESSEHLSQFSLSPIKNLLGEENNIAKAVDNVEKDHAEITKVKNINAIQLGIYEIDTWYFSPYPEEYGEQEKLFICEYCLKYMKLEKTFRYHLGKCEWRAPPGNEVYRKGTLVIHEVDPVFDRLYCQNLCLLGKLFIDHKTIFFDVEQFLFYVLCEVDENGVHIRGYFSKEKESAEGFNLACILTLPPFQGQGYGKLLIGFSYELSKLEGVVGTPEKPLSDLGKLSYRSYWSWVLLDILKDFQGCVSISHLSKMTGMTVNDIVSTLQAMNMLKYWNNTNTVCVTPALVESHILSHQFKRPRLTVDANAIVWCPYKIHESSSDEDQMSVVEDDHLHPNSPANSSRNGSPSDELDFIIALGQMTL